ncbi:MAG: D-tyrosyl-tRNA(Tyr) deacylase [Nitrosopumilus sp. B06]|nr:MAG: D-tyrosyl-tRNA(Tyr) deacylase [Nitrosopumilus sp. B06]
MNLLVAYRDDPAGSNMARYLSEDMRPDGGMFRGKHYDLVVIPTPAVSADWLEEKYDYDGYVFLSKHAAESERLALTCHSLGNFAEARFGGNKRQVAVPYPQLQKDYMRALAGRAHEFPGFHITIEATHHGPTALDRPAIFVEIGTTKKQWNDESLCSSVASIVHETLASPAQKNPAAVCFGGTHYPAKFTCELLEGRHALGTVVPKHALGHLDESLFSHIMERNAGVRTALLDWAAMGPAKQKILNMLESTDLEVIRL